MFSDKIFLNTLIISAIIHGLILFQPSGISLFSRNKPVQNLEVSYLKVKPTKEEKEAAQKNMAARNEPLLKLPAKISAKKITPPPFIEPESIFKQNKETALPRPPLAKSSFAKPDIIAIKKKIVLPPLDVGKITNPYYLNYYQVVREKIRRAAYHNYSYAEVGEVYLFFVISSAGSLEGVQLIEEKSSSIPYLKKVALRSIQEAAPFPRFPKELDFPQLSFNVVISFQTE
jgi:outer membrane biosynthesis protein TonB